jgi:hypothetical protein
MIEILNKMFDATPDKSMIVLNVKCSGCGSQTIIKITPTSEGFGVMGGILFKRSPDRYLVKCPACHEANPKADKHKKMRKILKNSTR